MIGVEDEDEDVEEPDAAVGACDALVSELSLFAAPASVLFVSAPLPTALLVELL